MTVKEYLSQARLLDQRINWKIKEKKQLMDMACSVSSPRYDEDRVQTSPSGSAPFERALQKVWDMEAQITKEIDLLVDLKQQINTALDSMSDVEESAVLRMIYMEGASYGQISEELFLCTKTIRRRHLKGLENFEMPENPICIFKNR